MNIEGMILAAGFSKRANTYKMTLELEGKTVVERCIEGMYPVCSKIILVGGYRIDDLRPVCSKYSKVKLIFNENFEEGMFSSVKAGLQYIKGERCFIIPGDYPLVKTNTYKKLANIREEVVIPKFKGIKGHPCLIKSSLIQEILKAKSGMTLRDFIKTKQVNTIEVEDQGILMDIDTMTDYEIAATYLRSKADDLH